MSGLLVLIPIALFLALTGLFAFLWALRSGQFEDLQGAAHRILDDDGPLEKPVSQSLSGKRRARKNNHIQGEQSGKPRGEKPGN